MAMYCKIILSFVVLFIHYNVSAENSQFFKVPLEIRKQNRPTRLVDNANDPDMRKLKDIQDKFFDIVGNSSLGKEYKSFNQLLQLVDSESGIELGRLMLNGFMIAIGKDNSYEILHEFLDDFQYRVSPDLAEALIDYKDFLKTVDLRMIPLTIQTLFRKDELGNSFAQMPLGQLVDLVQPEASKYGIDIRSVVNGILGKGDSTFPDLVRKALNGFNINSIINNVSKSVSEGMKEIEVPDENVIHDQKPRERQDKTLLLFKPLVAQLLRQNNVDLEPDAVIQVLSAFIAPLIQSFTSSGGDKSNGMKSDFSFSQLLPILTLFSSQFQDNRDKSNDKIQELASSFMGGSNQNLGAMLSLASTFLNNINGAKPKASQQAASEMKETESHSNRASDLGIDTNMWLQMASALTGLNNNDGSEPDFGKMIQQASELIGGISKMKDMLKKPSSKTKKGKARQTFPDVFDTFLLRVQTDEKCQTKIKDAITLGKTLVYSKFQDIQEFKEFILYQLKGQNLKSDILKKADAILSIDSNMWYQLLDRLSANSISEAELSGIVDSVANIVQMISSEGFQANQNILLKSKLEGVFADFGVKKVTLDNFPNRLAPLATMASKGWNLPVNLESLLVPLQYSMQETWSWYEQSMRNLRSLSDDELHDVVKKSLLSDIANPLSNIWEISKISQSSSVCLPRAVCDYVQSIDEDDAFKIMFSRLMSILYGAYRTDKEDNFMLILQITRAAFTSRKCQEYFPNKCKGHKIKQISLKEETPTTNKFRDEL